MNGRGRVFRRETGGCRRVLPEVYAAALRREAHGRGTAAHTF